MPSDDEVTSESALESEGPQKVEEEVAEGTHDEQPSASSDDQEQGNVDLLDSHAPPNWRDSEDGQRIEEALAEGREVTLVIVAADIRKSTFLMKEAIDQVAFAGIMSGFVGAAKNMAHKHGGWFDKFTGDGFLAYWSWGEADDLRAVLQRVWRFTIPMMRFFEQQVVQDFRQNSQNFPQGIGLSLGLDAGPCRLAAIGGDVTIVGPPVVGAVRMVSASAPGEMLTNVFLGELLYRRPDYRPTGAIVTREHRETKEYKQEVYPVDFQATP